MADKIGQMNKRILIEEYDEYTQDESGGYTDSWMPFYSVLDAAEATTSTTNIKMTDHGLFDGDYIINTSRSNAVRPVTVVDANNVTVAAVTGQVAGDVISKRSRANSTVWAFMKPQSSASSVYNAYNDHLQDTQQVKTTVRYRPDLETTKYRVRLYPSLARKFEIISTANVEEKGVYLEMRLREIQL